MMMMAMVGNSQTWERVEVPGDELKGTPDMVKYRINNMETLQSIMFYEGGNEWWVSVGGKVFQPDKSGRMVKKTQNFVTYATIGLYDSEGNLVEKFEDCMLELTNGMRVAGVFDAKKKGVCEVVSYITQHKGSVRIIIPTVIGEEFDLRVPCLNNE